MTVFFRQVKVLIWKNAILKLRHWLVLILEIAIPAALMLALVGLKSLSNPKESTVSYPATYWQDYQSFEQLYQYCPCDGENLVWRCAQSSCDDATIVNGTETLKTFNGTDCQLRFIAVAPSSSSNAAAVTAAQDFITWAQATYPISVDLQTFDYFTDENALLDFIKSPSYSVKESIHTYSSAIIFESGYPSWEYTFRYNQSYAQGGSDSNTSPLTSDSELDLSLKVNNAINSQNGYNKPYNRAYQYIGTFQIMDLVSSFAASMTCRYTNGKCSADENVMLDAVGVVDFPNPKTTIDGFWGSSGFIFGLLVIIAVLYPLANVISILVKEKEAKLREGMLMMALREDAYWVSWGFNFFVLFLVITIVLTLIGSGALFTHSNGFYIFIYFFVFFMGSVAYCFFISTLFSKSRTAVIIGILLFFGGYFVYVGLSASQTSQQRSSLIAAMIHPATAFTYGTLAFIEWEDTNIGITSNTWNTSNLYPITFQDCINMMFIDFFIYGFLCWYLIQVFPTEFGTQKPFYFPLLPSYWISCFKSCLCCFQCGPRGPYSPLNVVGSTKEIEMTATVEPVPEILAQQVEAKTCVDIRGLYKEFKTTNGTKVAVDHLSLTMYSGQITALLGHNGAGKTTAISILTGLMAADSGDAIVEGLSIRDSMDLIRKNLGVCPQHDILYRDLTVEEHLIMYASFKGCPRSEIAGEVEKMIQSVGLTEKRKVYSQNLSGGQKRKLSVAIAFIGGSSVVFLDEPTSGMDPYSRRFTWNVIRQHREGRIVVLTTHFMDEADLLGDRIAIMGDGRLLCCGSSLFLKRMYGVGYNMTMEKSDPMNFRNGNVLDLIHGRVPDAKVVTDVGAELTVQLPFSSSGQFQNLFEYLDDNLDSLGIRSYGMSVTTLEEVFINVAHGTKTQAMAENGRSKADQVTHSQVKNSAVAAAEVVDPEAQESPTIQFNRLDEKNQIQFFFRHMYAMLMKRYLYFIRDTKTWLLQVFLPVLFLLAGMLIMRYTSYIQKQPSKTLTAKSYNSGINTNYFPFAYTNADSFCPPERYNTNSGNVANTTCESIYGQSMLVNNLTNADQWPLYPQSEANTIKDLSTWLSNHKDDNKAMQVGAVTYISTNYSDSHISSVKYAVHSNFTAVHGAPLTNALVGQGVVQSINPSAALKFNIHPFPLTGRETAVYDSFNANLIATFILLAIPFIPAGWITYVVREREVKAKHVQLVSGVSVFSYWLATWLWDFMAYQLTMWGFVILITSFPNTETVSSVSSGALGVVIGTLILFGLAMSGFTYILSILYDTPAGAQVMVIFVVFVLGLLLTIAGYIFRLLSNKAYMNGVRYLFALFPPFALGDVFQNLTLIDFLSILELEGDQKYKPTDWEISGLDIAFLAWESVIYIGIVIGYEYLSTIPSFQAFISTIKASSLPPVNTAVKDEDVLEEELRVHDPEYAAQSTVLVKDIKKMYPGGKYAVKGVSLGIPKGQCFGLLGINGAGKSSLLGMLSGDFQPTSGEAYLAGLDLLTKIHECRRKIGFCPQFDALFELLTGREHLSLYARIKGIAETDIDRVVNFKIAEMGLTEYADRAAGTYSGGNKRKLSVAIAMIGEPDIVFLDEPSTGMDPVARRFMWQVITNIVTKRETCSMILTTHSMEECEALCTRIGIMVGGTLRCLGSTQRLRSKYGHGFQIEFGFVVPSDEDLSSYVASIATALSLKPLTDAKSDYKLSLQDVLKVLPLISRPQWVEIVTANGSASDLYHEISTNTFIFARSFASWCIMEDNFDRLREFLRSNFSGYKIVERQLSKIRIEVPQYSLEGKPRKLASMFGSVEKNKELLKLEEYSVCQTSLEQIFNSFAAQQEEELGHAAGIVSSGAVVNPTASL